MLPPSLIHINSYPGVGKFTIGRKLASELGAKLLDNHSVYNVAFALTEFKSDSFYDAVREVRSTAYRLAMMLSPDVPVILTNAHAQDSNWGNESWNEAIELARITGRQHVVILLDCARDENARRTQSVSRDAMRKPRDPMMFRQGKVDRALIERGADRLLRLEVTNLSANDAAASILEWLRNR